MGLRKGAQHEIVSNIIKEINASCNHVQNLLRLFSKFLYCRYFYFEHWHLSLWTFPVWNEVLHNEKLQESLNKPSPSFTHIYLTFGFFNSEFFVFLQFDNFLIFNELWHSQTLYFMLRLDNIKQRITKYISQYRLDFDLLNEANQFYLQTLINNLQCWKSHQTKHWVNRYLYQGHKSR